MGGCAALGPHSAWQVARTVSWPSRSGFSRRAHKEATDNIGRTPLYWAAWNGYLDLLWIPVEYYTFDAMSTAAYSHVLNLSSDFHGTKSSSDIVMAVQLSPVVCA
ncbi:hypothetical protein GQ53DRAFT_807444 [Thozetella sp. PMI_491]|nr:hypothetical protein GQ53DRAFT_807444 [Thozetella sp. PMI_491]